MRSVTTACWSMSLVLPLVCAGRVNAELQLLSGQTFDTVTSLTGTSAAVTIDLGSGPVSTGTISVSLDPSATSTMLFNWDTGTLTSDLHVLFNSPLFTTLGIVDTKADVVETGTMTPRPTYDPFTARISDFFIDLSGHGTVTNGPLAGMTVSWADGLQTNNPTPCFPTNPPPPTVPFDPPLEDDWGEEILLHVLLPFASAKNSSPQTSMASAQGTCECVPEPSSLLTSGTMILAGLAYGWTRHRRDLCQGWGLC